MSLETISNAGINFGFLLRDSILLSLRGQFSSSSGFVTPDELIHWNPANHKDTEKITS